MASRDAWGLAFCCGTSSVIRFAALQEIGGFPTDSVTEDFLLTVRLRERGYKTIYLNEKLSVGLAPEGLNEYATQRTRWCLGLVQICRGRSGPLRLHNGLPLSFRIGLIETFLYWGVSFGVSLPLSAGSRSLFAVQYSPGSGRALGCGCAFRTHGVCAGGC